MKFITCILFVIAFFSVQNIKAIPTKTDSAIVSLADTGKTKPVYDKQIQMVAVRDTRDFKLSSDLKKELKKGLIPKTSDYFKPNAGYCHDPKLLNDSTYVREFREAAYHRANHHSGGRAAIIAGSVIVGFLALCVIAYEIFGAK